MWRRLTGRGKPDAGTELKLTIPVDSFPGLGMAVYFTARDAGLPSVGDLTAQTKAWLQNHAEPRAGSALGMFIDHGAVELAILPRDQVPEPPMSLLAHIGLGELEERRIASATHVVVVRTRDSIRRPRLGLWSAIAVARASASQLEGVVLDPILPRVLPITANSERLPPELEIHIGQHIVVPFSVGAGELAWMTTSGMAKFGLPDLELWDLPPNLDQMSMVVNGVAQYLVRSAMAQAKDLEPATLLIDREIPVTRRDIAEAVSGAESVDALALVRLDLGRSPRAHPPTDMIQIVPPRLFTGEKTAWFAGVLDQLLGAEDQVKGVGPANEAMEAAHKRAVAKLPDVKQRFMAGLRPGETLFVKHGFPTEDARHEFMWIVVVKWTDFTVIGQLANTPQYREDLVMGQTIQLSEPEIFDWMVVLPGGRREGGYTTEVALGEGQDIG